MAVATELLGFVKQCTRTIERKRNGVWVVESSNDDPSGSILAWMMDKGLLRRSGSGAGGGLEVDGEVATEMGMPEYDYS